MSKYLIVEDTERANKKDGQVSFTFSAVQLDEKGQAVGSPLQIWQREIPIRVGERVPCPYVAEVDMAFRQFRQDGRMVTAPYIIRSSNPKQVKV